MADRDYDLVLLGATGFTGRLVAHHLAGQLAGTSTRWAIAGRDRSRLEALSAELAGSPAVENADVGDVAALEQLAGRTRALGTTVGPFDRYGEPVVAACVRAGTHYADIAGEPSFVNRIHRRYDAEARLRNVRVVSCCAFEAVPPDLGVQRTVAELADDVPIDVRGYLEVAGARPSGGTAHSAVDAIATRRLPRLGRADSTPVRPVARLPLRVHRVPELGIWGVPLPTIDPAVVLRSARTLDGYGTAFRYGHYAQLPHLRGALAGIVGVAALAGAASLPPTRTLLRRLLPSPGQGPTTEQRARSRFSLTFVAVGGDRRVITRVSGGEPAYEGTATMLGEAVRSLAFDDERPGGVVTPAVGLGEPYGRRLDAQGVRFEVLETT